MALGATNVCAAFISIPRIDCFSEVTFCGQDQSTFGLATCGCHFQKKIRILNNINSSTPDVFASPTLVSSIRPSFTVAKKREALEVLEKRVTWSRRWWQEGVVSWAAIHKLFIHDGNYLEYDSQRLENIIREYSHHIWWFHYLEYDGNDLEYGDMIGEPQLELRIECPKTHDCFVLVQYLHVLKALKSVKHLIFSPLPPADSDSEIAMVPLFACY